MSGFNTPDLITFDTTTSACLPRVHRRSSPRPSFLLSRPSAKPVLSAASRHTRGRAACCQGAGDGTARHGTPRVLTHPSPTETLSAPRMGNSRGRYLCRRVQINPFLFQLTPATPSCHNNASSPQPHSLTPQRKKEKVNLNEVGISDPSLAAQARPRAARARGAALRRPPLPPAAPAPGDGGGGRTAQPAPRSAPLSGRAPR